MVECTRASEVHFPPAIALAGVERPDDGLATVVASSGVEIAARASVEELTTAAPLELPALIVLTGPRRTPDRAENRMLADAAVALRALRRLIVVVCKQPRIGEVRALLQGGVRGIVLQPEMRRTLVPTLAAVAAGQVCVPNRHAEDTARSPLSMRERQAVGLAAMGLSNNEIAGRLFVAESTVKSHLSSAFSKLGVHSRHEAVELIVNPATGMGLGILSLDPGGREHEEPSQ